MKSLTGNIVAGAESANLRPRRPLARQKVFDLQVSEIVITAFGGPSVSSKFPYQLFNRFAIALRLCRKPRIGFFV